MAVRTIAQLPSVYPPNSRCGSRIADMLRRANPRHPQAKTMRVLIVGDSRATCPSGAGVNQVPELNAAFYGMYQHSGESVLDPAFSHGYSGNPPSNWLVAGSYKTAGDSVVSYWPTTHAPPGFTSRGHAVDLGHSFQLQTDAYDVDRRSCMIGGPYFDTTKPLYFEFFLVNRPDSPDSCQWWVGARSTGSGLVYWDLTLDSLQKGTIDTRYLQKSVYGVTKHRIGPFNVSGHKYVTVNLRSKTSGKYVEIIGGRFVSSEPGGVVLSTMSAGGYSMYSWDTSHSQSGSVVAAAEFDVIWFRTLFNEIDDPGQTLALMKTELLKNIGEFRDRYALRSDMPFIVEVPVTAPDQHNADLATSRALIEECPGMIADIADNDPNVLLLNTIKITKARGIDNEQQTFYGSWTDPGAPPATPFPAHDSASHSYSVGDIVYTGWPRHLIWHKCIAAHTSTIYNGPMQPPSGVNAGGHLNWTPLHWAFHGDEQVDPTTDAAHPSGMGSMVIANAAQQALSSLLLYE